MKCPDCGLENPETAECCDCGYSFSLGRVQDSGQRTHARRIRDLTSGGLALAGVSLAVLLTVGNVFFASHGRVELTPLIGFLLLAALLAIASVGLVLVGRRKAGRGPETRFVRLAAVAVVIVGPAVIVVSGLALFMLLSVR